MEVFLKNAGSQIMNKPLLSGATHTQLRPRVDMPTAGEEKLGSEARGEKGLWKTCTYPEGSRTSRAGPGKGACSEKDLVRPEASTAAGLQVLQTLEGKAKAELETAWLVLQECPSTEPTCKELVSRVYQALSRVFRRSAWRVAALWGSTGLDQHCRKFSWTALA